MMTAMDQRRTITAYFASVWNADEVAGNLRPEFEVQGPKRDPQAPFGRPYRLIIVIPESMSPMTMFPDSHLLSRIQNLVMAHDGVTSTPQGATT